MNAAPVAAADWVAALPVPDGILDGVSTRVNSPVPVGRAGLSAFYENASRDLGAILATTTPGTPAWTWSQDKTVGFIRRRQAHEALIHRIDAEPAVLPTGDRTAAAPDLSADGVVWRRPPVGPIERSGDAEVLDRFESAIAPGIS